jgi:predicted CoA-substrate-specific enzyme activase
MREKALGICLGASSIKVAELIKENNELTIGQSFIRNHESNPSQALIDVLNVFNLNDYDYVCATGRKFKDIIALPIITEPEATEYALKHQNQDIHYDAVASLGAENFIAYFLNDQNSIMTVETGNKCASGTGEFFLQQIRRMNVSVEEATELAKNSEIHKVSGRCSVFCKSDCTHALNIGIPIGEVCAGLSLMIANKALDLIEKSPVRSILVVGGVANNELVLNFLRDKISEVRVPHNYDVFEAFGAACFAMENKVTFSKGESYFKQCQSAFDFLAPISESKHLVTFKEFDMDVAKENDECILGLDVGSTTTKAVLVRTEDNNVLASIYLRTEGDPVKASRNCYRSIREQIKVPIKISGLGVTGSGRQIAGLHAMSDSVINEIIAHATAAVYFDPEVDTIFEIGGQDAKYTYITNGVPSDYAMNEACSAGTGSFLEESAHESLGVIYTEIEKIALQGQKPPNFNDQCAAFISSDIKSASQEGIAREDIVAGLVYSICMNYDNRVKGARPTGKKIFMQGGVCYNKAVPLAMASLIDREIIVPPEPGLMGALGVALEVKNRIALNLTAKKEFNLDELIEREVSYLGQFACKGGNEKCDRACEIKLIGIEGKKYPFGGACNKYYNLLHGQEHSTDSFDYVRKRQEIIFEKYLMYPPDNMNAPTIGISRTFLTNTLYPLYHNFFTRLGFRVLLSDETDEAGIKKKSSSFCYPAEIAHGQFSDLLNKKTDYIFLPQVTELFVEKSNSYKKEHQCTCFLLQSEPYYIKSAFKDRISKQKVKILSPVLDFSKGLKSQEEAFIKMAYVMGINATEAQDAFEFAEHSQQEAIKEIKSLGVDFLERLSHNEDDIAIVVFGRPYNAFAGEANLGIPAKFASRGIHIVPYDLLPFEDTMISEDITWALGQNILKAANYIKQNPQLYGTFITNFSCGPDSFLITYFREVMGNKPSLTLELDSHTADAGVNTRIEAFLDIIDRYRKIKPAQLVNQFKPAELVFDKKSLHFKDCKGQLTRLKNEKVHIVFPSMGTLTSEAAAATFRGMGFNATALPKNDFLSLKMGRKNTSCKECLPLILMTGSLMKYLKNRVAQDEYLVYFMPTASGNCRFAQYNVFLNKLIKNNKIENVALLTLTPENSYAGIGTNNTLNVLKAIIISDVMDNIRNSLRVLAVDKREAINIFKDQWDKIIECLEKTDTNNLYDVLEDVAYTLKNIPLKQNFEDAKVVSLLGEIFVRKNEFSCQDLFERLARKNIILHVASTTEWLYYVDYLVKEGILESEFNLLDNLKFYLKRKMQYKYEREIKSILSKSKLCHHEIIDIEQLIEYGKKFVDIRLTGEPIIVIGAFFKEVLHSVQGVISIGPFACLPTRVTESILSPESTIHNKVKLEGNHSYLQKFKGITRLPFLSIESDGNPFPTVIESRIEAFCLQVDRVHQCMQSEEKTDLLEIQK